MPDNKQYVGGTEATEILGVHQRTLYNWDSKGIIETIRTPGGKRLYNVEKFLKEKKNIQHDDYVKNLNELDKDNSKLCKEVILHIVLKLKKWSQVSFIYNYIILVSYYSRNYIP